MSIVSFTFSRFLYLKEKKKVNSVPQPTSEPPSWGASGWSGFTLVIFLSGRYVAPCTFRAGRGPMCLVTRREGWREGWREQKKKGGSPARRSVWWGSSLGFCQFVLSRSRGVFDRRVNGIEIKCIRSSRGSGGIDIYWAFIYPVRRGRNGVVSWALGSWARNCPTWTQRGAPWEPPCLHSEVGCNGVTIPLTL